jgi:hypothetical protein
LGQGGFIGALSASVALQLKATSFPAPATNGNWCETAIVDRSVNRSERGRCFINDNRHLTRENGQNKRRPEH